MIRSQGANDLCLAFWSNFALQALGVITQASPELIKSLSISLVSDSVGIVGEVSGSLKWLAGGRACFEVGAVIHFCFSPFGASGAAGEGC